MPSGYLIKLNDGNRIDLVCVSDSLSLSLRRSSSPAVDLFPSDVVSLPELLFAAASPCD